MDTLPPEKKKSKCRLSGRFKGKISWYLRREICCLAWSQDSPYPRDLMFDLSSPELRLFSSALAEHLVVLCEGEAHPEYAQSRAFVYESVDAQYFCKLIGLRYTLYRQIAEKLEQFFSQWTPKGDELEDHLVERFIQSLD